MWTFFAGEPWYHCEGECDGFRQLELFDGDGVRPSVRRNEPFDRYVPEGKNELPF